MLSLLKTEKTLDFTDRVKNQKKKIGCYNTAIQSKKSYFNICILDSSILPLNHVKLREGNIKAKKNMAVFHQYSKT